MIVKSLLGEFEHEVNNTRKLLQAVPSKDIHYKPSPNSWTMGELSQHIATIYYWYKGVFAPNMYDMATEVLQRGDPHDIDATRALFESNAEIARKALDGLSEAALQEEWTLKLGDRIIIDAQPRAVVLRGFLFNHTYHHRGELIVYLRSTGNKVPGLYGPTYEDLQARKNK